MPTQRRRAQQSPTERITEVDQTTGASDVQTENDGVDETVKQEKCKWQPTTEKEYIPLHLFEPDRAVTANDAVQYAILSKKDCNINKYKGHLYTTNHHWGYEAYHQRLLTNVSRFLLKNISDFAYTSNQLTHSVN